MCKVSNKLKLCTCKTSINTLKHYWVFFRYDGTKKNFIIGEPMLPVYIDPESDKLNKRLLLQLLNDGNVFDVPLVPVENDRLLISFSIGAGEKHNQIYYGFVYKKKKWKSLYYDSLEWEWKHNIEKTGKIENSGI